ncbi:MarC family protein [cyanobiont of Ornithocercus magnificus]|nr:MarC family protein [cyanobiont of Ornithocercus magnificus]
MSILNTTLGLVAISEPISILPLIYKVSNHEPSKIRLISRVSSLTYLTTMLLFCWLGREFLSIIGITIYSFKIAGGLILLPIGLRLIEGGGIAPTPDLEGKNVHAFAHVPIGIPLLAGPAAISLVILEDGGGMENRIILSAVIALIATIIYSVFNLSLLFRNLINERLIETINQFTGMLLVSISIQMVISGIRIIMST